VLKNIIKNEGGFTLLELLIVIVIIGILALLIIPNITSAPKKARDTQRKTDLRAIQKGLEEYFVSNNIYPGTTGQADTVLTALTSGNPPIMKSVPIDPKSTGAYVYTYTPANTNTTYALTGCLENGGDNGTSTATATGTCTTRMFVLNNAN
jgi:general secretion pathway protein G